MKMYAGLQRDSVFAEVKIKSLTITKTIFGYVKSEPKPFDFTAFCTLGVFNDNRGGDSCGIFIDGKSEYYCKGGKSQSLFFDFMSKSKLLHNTENATIAIGHCRKASVGDIGIATAQPVIIYKEGTKIPEFVVMHNGTIYNYEELAKKYIPNVDIKGKTDSQVLALIFYYCGYDVLAEYNGAGVFVIVDYRKESPKFMVFQGESKEFCSSAKTSLERDFSFVFNEDEFLFSSELDYLPCLRKGAIPYNIPSNTLVSICNGKLYNEAKYDRTSKQQSKIISYTNTGGNYNGHNSTYYNNNYYQGYCECVHSDFSTGQCKFKGVLLNGHYYITEKGKMLEKFVDNCFSMYFWNGIMLKNLEAYQYLTKFATELSATPAEVFSLYPELVYFLSPYNFYRNISNIIVEVTSPFEVTETPFNGTLFWPFGQTEMRYRNGVYSDGNYKSVECSLERYKRTMNDKIDYKSLLAL